MPLHDRADLETAIIAKSERCRAVLRCGTKRQNRARFRCQCMTCRVYSVSGTYLAASPTCSVLYRRAFSAKSPERQHSARGDMDGNLRGLVNPRMDDSGQFAATLARPLLVLRLSMHRDWSQRRNQRS